MTRRVARRIAGLVTSMALALGCAGPAPTATSPAPTATQTATATQSAPPEIGIFGQPVDAGCAIDTAWGAGPGVTVLPRLPDCAQPVSRWQSLSAGGTLATDSCGEAWLNTSCGRIYLFQDGRLQTSLCNRATAVQNGYCQLGVTSLPEMPVINLRAAGGRLSEPRIWDALLLTMAWDEQVKVSFPEGDGSIFALNGKAPPRDLRVQARNFKRASDLIHELAPDRFPVTVIAERTRGDDDLVARWVAQLRELSFRPVTVEATDAEDGAKLFAKLVGGETATIWIAGH